MSEPWIGLAHEALTSWAFQEAALDVLDARIGFDRAFFAVSGQEASASARGFRAAEVVQRFAPGSSYQRELLPVKTAALRGQGVALDTAVLGQRGVQRTAYFREFVEPHGGTSSLMAYLRLRGVPYGVLVLGRAGPFHAREVESLERLLPALSVARSSYGVALAGEAPLPAPPTGAVAAVRRVSGAPLARVRLGHGGELVVRDRGGHREMVAVEGSRELVWSRARLDEPCRSGWPYLELFHVAAALSSRRGRVLFIGCGGGVAVRQFVRTYPGIAADVVDVEPAALELARRWFGLGELPGVALHVADGFDFVAEADPRRWDCIVVDAYGTSFDQQRFTSGSFFAACRRALTADGAVAINVIGALDAAVGPVRAAVHAASRAFDDVRVLPVVEPGEVPVRGDALRNVVVIAR